MVVVGSLLLLAGLESEVDSEDLFKAGSGGAGLYQSQHSIPSGWGRTVYLGPAEVDGIAAEEVLINS